MQSAAVFPLVSEFPYQDPCQLFSHFKDRDGALFLDSAQLRENCGRYSYIALDPFQILSSKNGVLKQKGVTFIGNPFTHLEAELAKFKQETLPALPDFQGGVAGYFGYELAQHLEKLPLAPQDDRDFPDLLLGFYDLVLGFDVLEERAWIFSSGFPEQEAAKRQARAAQRLASLLYELKKLPEVQVLLPYRGDSLAVFADCSPQQYQARVQKGIDYILAGDIFEVNLSQRFCTNLPPGFPVFDLYRRLRKLNPAPFSAFLHFKEAVVLSASPERFLKLKAGAVETRPIKGTCPRGKSAEEDALLAKALLASIKDRAENVMIVDLLRNDLSRVCEDFSVLVPQLCGLETYPTVHHLVSVITGKLRQNVSALDLLKVSFPGGSITGAPKLRAMEIIAELEPTQRGPYCGSIAYLGFDGNMDSSITIRSYYLKNQQLSFQAGGAVVADSDPAQEQEEVLIKARALFKALESADDFINR